MNRFVFAAALWLAPIASALAQSSAQPVQPGYLTNSGCPAGSSVCFIPGAVANPTSTLTRPSDTTAYASGDLIASSTTAGSVAVPSFSVPYAGVLIPRLRLTTNATTGWGATLTINLWSSAPTYTNGDNGAYSVATGGANFLGSFSCSLTQFGDAASGACSPTVGTVAGVRVPSGTSIYWDLQTTGAVTPISGQTFKVFAEVVPQ